MEKLVWCFKIKNGLRLTKEDWDEANGYEELSKKTLEELTNIKSDVWKIVLSYYAVYYKLYSVLRIVGIKSENHTCSFLAFEEIIKMLGEDDEILKKIIKLWEMRKEAQYYGKIGKIDINEVNKILKKIDEIKQEVILRRKKIRKFFEEMASLAMI